MISLNFPENMDFKPCFQLLSFKHGYLANTLFPRMKLYTKVQNILRVGKLSHNFD